MKKNLITLALLLLIGVSGFSQKKLELSLSASPTLNWMSPGAKEVQNKNSTFGYEFGVNADIFLDADARYALATGLLIVNSGGELTFNTSDNFVFGGETFAPGTSIHMRIDYLEVPLALKLRTKQFYRWTYWGLFGLSNMVNVGAKGESSDGLLDKADINDEVKLFNMSLNIGAGAEYDLGERNALLLGIVYKGGLFDMTKQAIGAKTTVNSVSFKLGLVF